MMVQRTLTFVSLIVILLLCCNNCEAAKILVFGVSNSKSHMISNGRIAETLAKNGHDVTFANLEVGHSITRFSGAKHHKVVPLGYVTLEEELAHNDHVSELTKHVFDHVTLPQTHAGILKFASWLHDACERVLVHNSTTLEELKEQRFDALITEQLSACGSALTEVLDIPVHFLVGSSALTEPLANAFGVPTPMGYVPASNTLGATTDKMGFMQRANNLLESEVISHALADIYDGTTKLFQKYYGPGFPNVLNVIVQKTPFVFVAVDDLIEFPRPWPPNVIRIGGLGIDFKGESKALAEPFASEMLKGAKGVVFFSMGSNANTAGFPESVKQNLFNTMKKLSDHHFIVKLDKDDADSRQYLQDVPNVFVTTWAPQPLLLRHPRLKLFITHGGYNSILEVAHSGKPILLLPMMYDQTRNAGIVERNGWGKYVNKETLLTSHVEFETALRDLLDHENYTIAAQRIQKLLETKPFSPDEVFIKHVNFALANNGKLPELMSVANTLNVVQQHNFDVWALFLVSISVILVGFVKTIVFVVRLFTASNVKSKTQ